MVVFFFRLLKLSHVALFHFTFVIVDDAAEEGFAALDDENGRLRVGEIDFVRFFGNASREQFDDFLGSRFVVFTLRRAVLLEAHFEGFSFLGIRNFFFRKVERHDFVREFFVFRAIGAVFNGNDSTNVLQFCPRAFRGFFQDGFREKRRVRVRVVRF